MPNESSNRSSAEGASGAEAERMNRTRPGTATGGSMARIVMIAGTALIQVICRVPISSQNPRRLNLRSTTRQAPAARVPSSPTRSEEHTSELQSQFHLVCRLLLEKKKKKPIHSLLIKKKKRRLQQ